MPYYTHTNGKPANQTRGLASEVRDEFDKVAASFALLPAVDAIQSGRGNYALDTGIADAYVITAGSAVLSYADGATFLIRAANANTGPATLNVNGLGLKTIVRPDGSALKAADIFAGQIMQVSYDATAGKFQLQYTALAAANQTETLAAQTVTLAAQVSSNATIASTAALNAGQSETNSATSEFNSGQSANASAASAAAAAYAAQAGATLTGTSTTSLSVTAGSKTLATNTSKAWAVGSYINLARTSAPTTTSMRGAVTAYDPATGAMTVLVDDTTGSGTYTDWTLSVAGLKGAGATIPVTAVSGTTQTAVAGNHYAMTNVAASTVTLPAAAVAGDQVLVTFTNGLTTNSILANGLKVRGVVQDITADLLITYSLKYISAAYGWEIL